MQDSFTPPDEYIREPERFRVTGLSRTTWWRLEQQGRAPRRRKLSANAVGWLLSEIRDWQQRREVGGPAQDEQLRDGLERHLAEAKLRSSTSDKGPDTA